MTPPTLRAEDLRFLNLVAVRTFGGDESHQVGALEGALAAVEVGDPYHQAASLAAAVARPGLFGQQPLVTALLAMTCQLELGGYQLLAPQGAIAGMVQELAAGVVDVATVARWLEDRAVRA